MKKILMGLLVANAVLLGVLAYILAELPASPKPTIPMVKYIFVTNTAPVAIKSGR